MTKLIRWGVIPLFFSFFLVLTGCSFNDSNYYPAKSPHYAEGYFHSYSNPVIVEIPSSNTYYMLFNYTIDDINGFTYNSSGLIVNRTSTYLMNFMFAMSGGNSGDYELELHKNMIPQPDCSSFITTTSTDHIGATITCIKSLERGDVLALYVKDRTNPSQNIQYHQLDLNIIEVGR